MHKRDVKYADVSSDLLKRISDSATVARQTTPRKVYDHQTRRACDGQGSSDCPETS